MLRAVIISERWKRREVSEGLRGPRMETLALLLPSFQQRLLRKPRLPPAASARHPLCGGPLLTDAISHTGSKKSLPSNLTTAVKATARACLTNLLLRVLRQQRHIFTHTTTHTHSHTDTKFFYHIARTPPPKKKKNPALNVSLSCFLYPCLYVAGCWIYCDRIHLMSFMFAGLIVLM